MINFGAVPAGSVLPIIFDAFDGGTGASITLSGLAVTDIEVYKGASITQRASDAGYALIDTDGIDIDGITGIHGFSIDTGDNTDAGFYTVGSFFTVVVSSVTIDGQTVSFVAATFRLVAAEAIAGKPKVDVDGWLGTAAATPTVAGVPEVDLTHVGGAAQTATLDTIKTETAAIVADTNELQTDWANGGRLDLLIDAIKAVTDALTNPSTIATAVWAAGTRVLTAATNITSTGGTTVPQTGDSYTRLGAPAGASVSADIAAVKGETASILGDTNEVQTDLANGGRLDLLVDAIKAKTDNLPAAPSATGDIPTANQNADALLDRANGIETGYTLRQMMRLFASALLGKVSGMDTNAPVFRDVGDSKNRITASTDADGNRSAVTLDAS